MRAKYKDRRRFVGGRTEDNEDEKDIEDGKKVGDEEYYPMRTRLRLRLVLAWVISRELKRVGHQQKGRDLIGLS